MFATKYIQTRSSDFARGKAIWVSIPLVCDTIIVIGFSVKKIMFAIGEKGIKLIINSE